MNMTFSDLIWQMKYEVDLNHTLIKTNIVIGNVLH